MFSTIQMCSFYRMLYNFSNRENWVTWFSSNLRSSNGSSVITLIWSGCAAYLICFSSKLKMLKLVLSHLHWCDLDVLHNLFLKQLKKLKWVLSHLHWCDLDVLHNLFLKQLKKLKWNFTHLQLISRSWKSLHVKHILEESQATVKLQPDGVLHSVSQAAEAAQIGPCLSLLALLAKKQRTQVLDPPQTQSPQISRLQPPTSSSSSALLISLLSSSPRFLASGRSRNDNRFPSSSVTQIDAAWWLSPFVRGPTALYVADLFEDFQFGADPLFFFFFFFLFRHHSSSRARAFEQEPCCRIECKKSGKKSLARSVVKCEESGGERERERKRDSFYYGLLLLLLPSSSVVGMWGTTTVFFLDPDLTSIFYKKKIDFFTHVAAFVIPAFFFCSYNMYWFPNQNLCETKQKEEEEAALRRGWCSSSSA